MFRRFSLLSARAVNHLRPQAVGSNIITNLTKSSKPLLSINFCSLSQKNKIQLKTLEVIPLIGNVKGDFLQPILQSYEQKRTVIKFSWKSGRRKTVKAVIRRFYRLNCANWIRTIAGRHKKIWKKKQKRRRKHKEHVFCNGTQCNMLDKMVSRYWRKPKYYINNPYEPYEWRENFIVTRTKPWRPEGVDYE